MDQSGDICFIGQQPNNGQGGSSYPTNQLYVKNNGLPGNAGVSARTYNAPWGSAGDFAPRCVVIPLNSVGIYDASTGNIRANLNINDGNTAYPQAKRYMLVCAFPPPPPLPPPYIVYIYLTWARGCPSWFCLTWTRGFTLRGLRVLPY